MFTQIDETLLAILGATVMGIIQAVKPFMPDRFVLPVLGILSLSLGVVLAFTVEATSVAMFVVQCIVNAYLIAVSASGPYSLVKSSQNKENPAGL